MHGRQPYGYKTGILGVVHLGVGFDSCGIFYIGSRAYVCLYVYLSVCLSVCLSRCCLARVEEEGAKLIRLPRPDGPMSDGPKFLGLHIYVLAMSPYRD